MADASDFLLTALKASRGKAVKCRELIDGVVVKTDHTLTESRWKIAGLRCSNDADKVANLLGQLNDRSDIATVHGAPAPGISPSEWQPRWSSEHRGPSRTIVEADRSSIPFDFDKVPLPPGSTLGEGQNIVGLAHFVREEILPPAFRYAELVIRASSSTGFNPTYGSLHCYTLLDGLVPLATIYGWLRGMQASGLPIDPRPALPGQLFLSARPELIGIADPVPKGLRVFVLPGSQRYVRGIDWNEFEPQLAVRVATEHAARSIGAAKGWRAVLDHHLGDDKSKDQLGFFEPLSTALGFASRSPESADEIIGAMHAIVSAHPDCNAERAGRYTPLWLRRELLRLRAKDAAADARADAMRKRLFPAMRFDR